MNGLQGWTNLWDDAGLKDEVNDAVTACYGEPFEFRPQAKMTVNDPVNPDPLRAVQQFIGIWNGPTNSQDIDVRRGANPLEHEPHMLTLAAPRVSLDERDFPNGLPNRSDILLRLRTAELYSVETVIPDRQGRCLLMCAFVGFQTDDDDP